MALSQMPQHLDASKAGLDLLMFVFVSSLNAEKVEKSAAEMVVGSGPDSMLASSTLLKNVF